MGLFVLMYTLAVGVRARTRDLAVLRAIGLPARRVRRVLAWQGTVLGVGMALVGIPVGLLLGSAIWGRVTDQLGVHPGVVVTPTLLLVGPITVLFAIGASLYPGRRASREQITALLRAE
jgi:putative ABC transport system permease protein